MPSHTRNDASAASPRRPHQRKLLRICGRAAVAALFERDPDRVERLFFDPRLGGEFGAWCETLAGTRRPYRQAGAAELARLAGTVLHGGVVAIARPRPPLALDHRSAPAWARDGKPLLVLDGIGNPHNLGAIVRTAAFFGIERIVLAERADQALPSDASYRVAEGGFEYLNVYRAAVPAALYALRPAYRIIGTAPGRGALPDLPRSTCPPALLLGNEEHGLDAATLAACDEVIAIPDSGRVQSLNVAAAAAILIYLSTR